MTLSLLGNTCSWSFGTARVTLYWLTSLLKTNKSDTAQDNF